MYIHIYTHVKYVLYAVQNLPPPVLGQSFYESYHDTCLLLYFVLCHKIVNSREYELLPEAQA
jgi:hypothetical protein